MKKVLAVDIGTQSLKASIFDEELNTLERVKVPYEKSFYSAGKNRVEMDEGVLWSAFVTACDQLENKLDVDVLSFSSLLSLMVMSRKDGEALAPIVAHLDRRSAAEAQSIIDNVGPEKCRAITGNLPIPGGITVTSMMWFKRNMPEIADDMIFGPVSTFFVRKLTGNFVAEPTNTSFSGLYETTSYGGWSDYLLSAAGISRDDLPEIVDCTDVCGYLKSDIARQLGLTSGLPVVIGANDTVCAVTGAGIKEPGVMLNTSGTVEILLVCTDKPFAHEKHLLRTHAYKGLWLAMRTLGAGGASIEWFRRTFCLDMSEKEFYNEYVINVLKDRSGDIVFKPYLSGDRHKMEQVTASFDGVTLDSSREDFLYSIFYNNIKFQAEIIPIWEEEIQLKRDIFHVGGGAVAPYTDLKKEVFGAGYEFVDIGETAERGAAILGLDALR